MDWLACHLETTLTSASVYRPFYFQYFSEIQDWTCSDPLCDSFLSILPSQNIWTIWNWSLHCNFTEHLIQIFHEYLYNSKLKSLSVNMCRRVFVLASFNYLIQTFVAIQNLLKTCCTSNFSVASFAGGLRTEFCLRTPKTESPMSEVNYFCSVWSDRLWSANLSCHGLSQK